MATILASGISGIPHLAAFDLVAEARLQGIDLTAMMMYIVDEAPESALFSLARQFNVTGIKGWTLATTVEQRRELIKNAISLWRFHSTPWAIKEALRSVGFGDVIIHEGVAVVYDGEHNHDGDITYGSGDNWATFSVSIEVPDSVVMSADVLETVRSLILQYKNARSHLVGISLVRPVVEAITVEEELVILQFDPDDNPII